MKKRVSKRLSKVLSKRLTAGRNQSDLSNGCVRYQGVSVAFLEKFLRQLLADVVAPDVQLLILQKDTQGLKQGTTVELVSEVAGGGIMCGGQFIDRITLQNEDVISKVKGEWTIEDVCEYAILPMCAPRSCFYLDIMDPQAVGKTYQGSFVSNARKSSFADLVNSLVEHFESKRVPLEKAFVWLDVFCANQPKLLSRDQVLSEEVKKKRWKQLTFGLHDAIKFFDDRLIFFSTWLNPYPLQRAWCLWEIFGAIQSGKSVDIIFGPGATDHFVETLKNEFESIMQNLADIDFRKAKCHNQDDLEMIRNAVESSLEGGFAEVNNLIADKLRAWLLESARAAVGQARKQESSLSKEELGDLALVLNQAGAMLRKHGQNEKALEFYSESLLLCRAAFGNDHPGVAVRLHNIGLVHRIRGEYDKALNHFHEALTIDRNAFGDDHPNVALRIQNIGMVYELQGKYDEALKRYQKALIIDRKALGSEHPNVAKRLANIGSIYHSEGKYDEALKHYHEAVAIDRRAFGNDHPNVASGLNNIGEVHREQRRYKKALEYFNEAFAIDRKAFGSDHPRVAVRLSNIGAVYYSLEEYDQALERYNEAITIDQKHFGNAHVKVAIRLNNIGEVYRIQGKYDLALKHYKEALAIDRYAFGNNHPKVATRLNNMGLVFDSQGDYDEALKHYNEALAIHQSVFGSSHPNVATCLTNIGAVYLSQDKRDKAKRAFNQALQVSTQVRGASHPSTKAIRRWLEECRR